MERFIQNASLLIKTEGLCVTLIEQKCYREVNPFLCALVVGSAASPEGPSPAGVGPGGLASALLQSGRLLRRKLPCSSGRRCLEPRGSRCLVFILPVSSDALNGMDLYSFW